MLDTLQKLCSRLSTDPLTAGAVASSIGKVEEDGGDSEPITVQPNDPAFSSATVVRKWETDEPVNVKLDLSDKTPVHVKDLVKEFGSYAEVPRIAGRGSPQVAFEWDRAGQPYTCTIFAAVEPGSHGVENGTVTSVTVRRDIRLD